MIRAIIALLLIAAATAAAQAYPAPYTCNRNFYVATTGLDSATCGASGTPCASMAGADTATSIGGTGTILTGGDCVHYAPGVYTFTNTFIPSKGGSQNTANGYVVHVGAPNHGSQLKWTGGYFGLRIETNYIVYDGFDFNGNDSVQDAFILIGYRKTPSLWQHHIWILNNLIHDSHGGGIATGGGDYYLFAGNTIYNTMYDSPWGQSGIEMYGPQPIAGFTATLPWDTQYYHIQVLQNITHDNGCLRENATYSCNTGCPSPGACWTDGNGIDFDDWINQQDGYPPYPYHGLIAGNLSYSNGGRGISIDPTTQNADVYNNTTWNNGLTTQNTGEAEFMMSGNHNNVVNNIFMGTAANVHGRVVQWNSAYGEPDTNDSITFNMTWNGTAGSSGVVLNNCGTCSLTAVTNDQLGVNPLLTNPGADFHPASGSPALGVGTAFPSAAILPEPGNVTPDGFTMAANPSNIGAYNVFGSAGTNNTVAGPVSIAAGNTAIAPYIADAGFNGGTGICCGTWTTDTSLVTTTTPAPQIVYQGQRFGPSFFYVINGLTAAQNYTVILHFSEDFDTAVGQREENVTINGTQVLTAFDIFAIAGAQHKAVVRSFLTPADTTGSITITFAAISGLADANAKIDAIRVLSAPTAANQTASTPYQTPITINLANGSTGTPLTAAVSGTPTGGTVAISGLTATFTPNTGFSGSASFQFTLSGDGGTSNAATASVTVGQPAVAAGPQPGHISPPYTCLRTFYVTTSGLDTNACSSSAPCASIQGAHNQVALQAGDCVSVGAGTYNTGATINLVKGGNANSATGYVAYISAPNRGSVINFNAPIVNGMTISGSYMIMDGFEFAGNSVVTGPAIIGGSYQTVSGQVHHAMILNSSIHDFGGAGIAFQSGDYYTLSGNLIYNNAWHSASGDNGLQIYEPEAIPGFTATLPGDTQTYHIQVLENVSHNNGCLRGDSNCTHGHGDGFAFQDFEGIQWQTGANSATWPCAYPYRSLVAGNLAYANGGRGLELAPNTSGVDLFNNTSYGDGNDPSGPKDEFTLVGTNNNIYNNLFWNTVNGNTINFNNTGTAGPDTGNAFGYDLTFNGAVGQSGVSVTNTSNNAGYLAQITGTSAHNQLGVAPAVTSVVTPDFHPLSGSPLLGAGGGSLASGYTIVTVDGNAFPVPTNIGGYDLSATSSLPTCATTTECFQYVPGLWYIPDKIFTSNGSTSPPGANIIRCIPAAMRSKATISSLAARVYNTDSSGHVQFAIYTNGANSRPATYAATSATVSVSSAGPAIMALGSNIQGGPGGTGFSDSFWLCSNTDSAKATFGAANSLGPIGPTILGSAISGNVLQQSGNGAVITSLSCSGAACAGGSSAYGSFPASLAGTTWTEETANKMPAAAFQVLSVP